MVHHISRREVLNNLIRFKEYLQERAEGERPQKGERVYKALLNCQTGDLRFAKKIRSLEPHISRKGAKKESLADWKEISLIVHQESAGEIIHFEVQDLHKQPVKHSELASIAWTVLSETVDLLNHKAQGLRERSSETLPEEAILQDLSSIQISVQRERIEDLLGWKGALSRIEAEQILTGKPVGTYVLREGDEITVSIAFHFSEENRLSIRPYLLTVVEAEEKISDILLLQTDKGWVCYHDDPNLNDPELYHYYQKPKDLLESLGRIAYVPLA